MPVQIVQGLRGEANVLKLQTMKSIHNRSLSTCSTYLDEAHGPVALLSEAQPAVPRLCGEERLEGVLQMLRRVPRHRGRKVTDVERVNLMYSSVDTNANKASHTGGLASTEWRVLVLAELDPGEGS